MHRIAAIADALRESSLDGWLFYDFRMSDPVAYRILSIPEKGLTTRRWFCFIPSDGAPVALVSAVEAHRLDTLPFPGRSVYRSEREMTAALANLLKGRRRIAMNYSPNCAIPYVSRVDGGTIELVRSLGLEVVSAADLIQRFEATLTPAQLEGHRRAATALRAIALDAFGEIGQRIRGDHECSEASIQHYVLEQIASQGMCTDEPPIVAVNANAANPHFSTGEGRDTPIHTGDLVLIDLFAKGTGNDAIYGDLTWMGYVGDAVPDEFAQVFAIVAQARDAVVALIQRSIANGQPITGAEADRTARNIIEMAGYGNLFVHRTGHSIGREVHGTGANLDSLETSDHRCLIENTCF
ncbi:MAG TPA: M24 family metallopeptidase, partial [Candidatus Binataceae bacterium]|nr:M24 family metallopeptidase [Candidatus Binataceae bacterium]